jgi:hypothetical protein
LTAAASIVAIVGHGFACASCGRDETPARTALYEAGVDLYVAVEFAVNDGDVERLDRWLQATRRAYDAVAGHVGRPDHVLDAYARAISVVSVEVEARRRHAVLRGQAGSSPDARDALAGVAEKFLLEGIEKRFEAKALLSEAADLYRASLSPALRDVPPKAREWDGDVVDFKWGATTDGKRALLAATRRTMVTPGSGFPRRGR